MLDLLMRRRTVRRYKDKEINNDIVEKIVQGALSSPTGRNLKPWELIVINDKKTLKNLSDVRGRVSSHIKGAGLGIVIAANPEITDIWIEDASIMATIIQLISESLGLTSCWIQVRDRLDDKNKSVEENVKNLLNIPKNFRVECMLAIGYPDETKDPHKKEDLLYNKVHYNRFG